MPYAPIPGVKLVVGITGAARHGKDEAARQLLKMFPGAERFAFSDALSVEARVHHGMTKRDPQLLQNVGMRMRETHPRVWLDCVYRAIEDRQPEVAIVTGVRFHDEANMIRDMGGRILRIVRVDNGVRYISPDRNPNHPAERTIDELHHDFEIVTGSGDMTSLSVALRQFVAHVGLTVAA
jgi:hypothetical protein